MYVNLRVLAPQVVPRIMVELRVFVITKLMARNWCLLFLRTLDKP